MGNKKNMMNIFNFFFRNFPIYCFENGSLKKKGNLYKDLNKLYCDNAVILKKIKFNY